MADEPTGRQYSSEEVEAILQRALERQTERGLTREELLAAAREAGISEESVRAAADEMDQTQDARSVTEGLKAQKRDGFFRHLTTYAIVNAGLFAMNLATNLATTTDQIPHWWFLFPLIGWGIGLAFHAVSALARPEPSEAEVQRAMALEAAQKRVREETSRSRETFERTVEEGVGVVLSKLEHVLAQQPPSDAKASEVRVSEAREAPIEEQAEAEAQRQIDDEEREARKG